MHRHELQGLLKRAEREHVALLFSAGNVEHNNAVVLMQYLKMLLPRR